MIKSLSTEDYKAILKHKYEKFSSRYIGYVYSEDYKDLKNEEKPLIIRWCDSFTLYGPERYPLDAILHAVASILIQFSIEKGDRIKVVDRLRKRLQRSSE